MNTQERLKTIKDKIDESIFAYGDKDLMKELTEFVLEYPDNTEGNFIYGKIFKSIKHLSKAIELNHEFCDAYYYRYRLYKEIKNDRKVYEDLKCIEKYLDKSEEINSYTECTIYSELSEYELMFGEMRKAISYLTKAIELSRRRDFIYFNKRADIYLFLKDYNNALDDINTSLNLDPTQSILYRQRGNINLKLGNSESAETDFKLSEKSLFVFVDKENGKEVKKLFERNFIKNIMEESSSKSINQCPKCKSSRLANYSYGLPDFENMSEKERQAINSGELILAGSILRNDSPGHICRDCGTQWGIVKITRS